jgi:thiamine biosynthesis lipoprotein
LKFSIDTYNETGEAVNVAMGSVLKLWHRQREMVDISDGECVVSSGDYQRYYEVDGVRYCHIIDPETLYPAGDFASVSVITDDSGLADSYSTALYTMSVEEGMDFVRERDNVEAMWIMHDGEKLYSGGFLGKYVKK